MAAWWLTSNDAYYNPERLLSVYVAQDGENWVIKAGPGAGIGGDIQLSGTWRSKEEALDVARELVEGFNPASL